MKILALLLLSATAFAAKPEPVYQDGVMKDFRTIQHGTSCTTNSGSDSTINANTDPEGHTNGQIYSTGSAHTNCIPETVTLYTIGIGEHVYVVTPRRLPFSNGLIAAAFRKDSDLSGVLPGTPIQIRSDSGLIYVKVGKRESVFKMVSAQ